jgi:uncharacterized membrane protein
MSTRTIDADPAHSPPAPQEHGTAPAAVDRRAYRLTSIDMLRGLVVVIMALDHARDFFSSYHGEPTSDPNVSLAMFATRWITHFCAPVFVFLAGTSAGLMIGRRNPRELGAFLLKRGLWLVFVEVFVVSTAWTFAPFGIAGPPFNGQIFIMMQVIWVIGASMVVLAGLQFFGIRTCLVIGAAIVLGHNLLDPIWPASSGLDGPLWFALHSVTRVVVGPFGFVFVYPLLPWIGVMLLGYGTAGIFQLPPAERDRTLLRAGLVLTAAFVVVRALDVYGDPHHWHIETGGITATIMSFVNTTKYPPSLQFLLMTLGPSAVLCAFADRFHGPIKDALVVFGRVPFAFYVAHLYLIHALAILLGVIQGFAASQFLTFFYFLPKTYGVALPGVYFGWLLVVAALYPFCRWFAALKARRTDWWLSYL